MGYAGSLSVCPPSRPRAPSGFTRMLSVSPPPSATGIGKQDNCQVAVSVSVAHERASVPVAYRLYLPEAWAQDQRRRRAAGVPDALEFRTKWQIALEQIAQLAVEGVPVAPVVADAGYGVVTAFRDALTARAIAYVVGISTETTVWAPGRAPLPPPKYRGHGRPPPLVRRTRRH